MPHREWMPPVPASFARPEKQQTKVSQYAALLNQRRMGYDDSDDLDTQIQSLLDKRGSLEPSDLQALSQRVVEKKRPSAGAWLLKKLEQASLPFTAFSEGINALVGPLVAQSSFQDRSARSRAILKTMFTGDVSVADAAGLLREVNRERSTVEQLITGILFDPLTWVGGAGAAVKAAKTGLGAAAVAKAGARGAVEWTVPFGGQRLTRALGLRDTAKLIKDRGRKLVPEIAGAADELEDEDIARQVAAVPSRIQHDPFKFRNPNSPVAKGASEIEEHFGKLENAARSGPYAEHDYALVKLAEITWGRPAEIAALKVSNVDLSNGIIIFKQVSKTAEGVEPGRLVFVNDPDLLAALKGLMSGKAPDAALFDFPGVSPRITTPSSKYDAVLERSAKAAGLTKPPDIFAAPAYTGNIIRHMGATRLAFYLADTNADIDLVRRVLGHKYSDLTTWMDYVSESVVAEGASRFLASTSEGGWQVLKQPMRESDLPSIEAARNGVVGKEDVAFRVTVEGRSRQIKGKAIDPRVVPMTRLLSLEGQSIISNIEINPELMAGLDKLAGADKELATTIFRLFQVDERLPEAQRAIDFLTVRLQGAPKGVIHEQWSRLLLEAQKEAARLVYGAEAILEKLPASAAADAGRLISSLGYPPTIARKIVSTVFEMPKWLGRLFPAISKGGFYGKRLAFPASFISKLKLGAIPRLPTLESLDDPSQRAAVNAWFMNPDVQAIIDRLGPLIIREDDKGKYFEASKPEFFSQMRRLSASKLGWILGRDMAIRGEKALTVDQKNARFLTLKVQLERLGYLRDEAREQSVRRSWLHPLSKYIFEADAAKAEVAQSARQVGGPWATQMRDLLDTIPRLPFVIRNGIHPNSLAQSIERWSREWSASSTWWQVRVGGMVRRALTYSVLRGAVASDAMKPLIAREQVVQQAAIIASQIRAWLHQTPGAKWMEQAGNVVYEIIDREQYPVFLTGLPVKKVLPKFKNKNIAGRADDTKLMQHVLTVFDGQRGVPTHLLEEYFDFTGRLELLELIRMVRATAEETTSSAVKRLGRNGKAILKEAIGTEPTVGYVPSIEAKVRIPDLLRVPFAQKGGWAFERTIPDAEFAIRNGTFYHHPIDAAAHYAGDLIRFAVDRETQAALIPISESLSKYEGAYKSAQLLDDVMRGILAGGAKTDEQDRLLRYMQAYKEGLFPEFSGLAEEGMKGGDAARAVKADVEKLVARTFETLEDERRLKQLTSDLPGLGRVVLKDETEAMRIREILKDANKQTRGWLELVHEQSARLRFFQAGFDLSAMFLQGIVALFYDAQSLLKLQMPTGTAAWGRAVGKMVHSLADPEVLTRYRQVNIDQFTDFIKHGGVMGLLDETGETYKAARAMRQWPLVGRWAGEGPRRTEASFTAFQDVLRLELWKGLNHIATRSEDRFHLASFINKMSGSYNQALAGMPSQQRMWEALLLSFAPSYRRAVFGLLANLFGTGSKLETAQAYKAIGSLATAAGIIGYMAVLTGNNPDALNPGSPKFLTFKVSGGPSGAGFNVGLGSAYYSLVRAGWSITKQLSDPDERGKAFQVWAVEDAALGKWWRSQAPVFPQMAMDFLSGRTYIGQSLRGEDGGYDPPKVALWAMKQYLPITVETIMENIKDPAGASAVFEAFGGRTFPVSTLDRFYALADTYLAINEDADVVAWMREQSAAGKPVLFKYAPVLIRQRMMERHPDLAELDATIQSDRLKYGRGQQHSIALYEAETDGIRRSIRLMYEQASSAFATGEYTAQEFRDRIRRIQSVKAAMYDRLKERPELADAINYFTETAKDPERIKNRYWLDHAYIVYTENWQTRAVEMTNEFGELIPERVDRFQREFRNAYGEDAWRYIRERQKQSRESPSLVDDYFASRETLQDYWGLADTLWPIGSRQHQLIQALNALSPNNQKLYRQRYPAVKQLETRLDALRQQYRRQHPDIDAMLVKWYDYAPVTSEGRRAQREWRELQSRSGGPLAALVG